MTGSARGSSEERESLTFARHRLRGQEPLFCKRFSGAGFEITLESTRRRFVRNGHVRRQCERKQRRRRSHTTALMQSQTLSEIVGRTDINVFVSQPKKVDVPHVASLPTLFAELRETPYALGASTFCPECIFQWPAGRSSRMPGCPPALKLRRMRLHSLRERRLARPRGVEPLLQD